MHPLPRLHGPVPRSLGHAPDKRDRLPLRLFRLLCTREDPRLKVVTEKWMQGWELPPGESAYEAPRPLGSLR